MMPGGVCRGACLITITVPESARDTVFQVDQAEDDVSWPLVTVQPRTTVGTIYLGAWWKPQNRIGIYVQSATVRGKIGGRLKHGDVRAVAGWCDFGWHLVQGRSGAVEQALFPGLYTEGPQS